MLLRIFGVILIVAGFGLGGISGYLAYFGFSNTIKLPLIGLIGPFVALSLVSLGVAVEIAFRRRKWLAFAPLFVLMVVAGLIDKNSGELALKEIVVTATQGDSDRNTAYNLAVSTKADLEKQIKDLEAEYKVITGDDIFAAQKALLARGLYSVDDKGQPLKVDGQAGTYTKKALAARGQAITTELGKVRDDLKIANATVAKGASVSEAPFTLHQAELYALMITVLSVVFAFAGSFVYGGFGDEPTVDEEIDELEEAAGLMESNIIKLAEQFGALDNVPKRKRG